MLPLISCKELSAKLAVHEKTLFLWARQGKIPCYRINGLVRFNLAEVEEWIRGQH